jgi:hypothetical protein
MSKIVASPVKRFPGTVTLADPLTYPQAIAWGEALDAARQEQSRARINYALLPGILACVEEWRLGNIPANPTPETFPSTPLISSAQLLSWLIEEISKLFAEAEDIPNA